MNKLRLVQSDRASASPKKFSKATAFSHDFDTRGSSQTRKKSWYEQFVISFELGAVVPNSIKHGQQCNIPEETTFSASSDVGV